MIFTLVCAVPSNFDLTYHLSLREMANIANPSDEEGMYFGDAISHDDEYKMDVELLKALAGTIAKSRVSVLTNKRPEMFYKLCTIFKDLGLVIHRRWDPNMAVVTTRRENESHHDARMFMLMAVNVLAIHEDEKWNQVLENVVKLEEYYPPDEVMKQYA